MATVDDLTQGIVSVLAGLLFPGTTFLNGSVANVAGTWTGAPGAPALSIPTRLYRGAPGIYDLDADISAGIAQVCVTSVPGMSRNTSRFQPYYKTVSANVPTLAVAWDSESATFGGTCAAGQAVGLTVNRVCYAYRTTGNDTPATVAAAFARQIPGASATGAVLSVFEITAAAVVCDQLGLLHTGTQQQMVQIAVLTPYADGESAALVRAAISGQVDGLKTMLRLDGTVMRFIGLPDGSSAHVRFHHSLDDDTPRNDDIWRRWLYFLCEFDETVPVLQPTAITASTLMTTGADSLVWLGPAPNVQRVLTDGAGNVLADASGRMLGSFS